MLIFPGIVPVTFDTAVLQTSTTAAVGLSSDLTVTVTPRLTEIGRRSLSASLDQAVRACLSRPDATCAFAVDHRRTVPGTVHGQLRSAPSAGSPTCTLSPADPVGRVTCTGSFSLTAHWTALDFENQPAEQRGHAVIQFTALVYLSHPDEVIWSTP
jgi:hypothetical protein